MDNVAYIISEYVHGPSLERLVRDERARDADSLVRLAIATSAALNGIHSAGIVHRDFKPANILIGSDGPRVIDFGVAKALDQMTMTSGGLKGTPVYMSPEQFTGQQVGAASDVFSWASTMFYGATGQLAFGGTTLHQVYMNVTSHHPDLSAVPRALQRPMVGCWEKDPRNRPTASEVMVAITH